MAQSYPIQIPSGMTVLPDVSGTNNIGSTSLYFNGLYANSLAKAPLYSGVTANIISGTQIFQNTIRVVDTITSSGVGVSLYNTKITDTAYLNSITGIGNITTYGPSNGIATLSGTAAYTIRVQALTSTPTDAQTIYFGMLPKAPVTAAGTSKCYVRDNGIIKGVEIYSYAGTAGSAESWTLYLRVNNTTDYTIATNAVTTNERLWSNWSLNGGAGISISSGSYFEIKSINPTWAPNPATLIFGGYVYIED